MQTEYITVDELNSQLRDYTIHFLQIINDAAGTQQTRFLQWLLEHMGKTNIITMNQRDMAKKSGISRSTVVKVIKGMEKIGMLKMLNENAYELDPNYTLNLLRKEAKNNEKV